MNDTHSNQSGYERAASVVDSPTYKILQAVIIAILTLIVGSSMSSVLNKLDKIEVSISRTATKEAVNELRMRGLERDRDTNAVDIRALQDKNVAQDYDLRRLAERTDPTAPQAFRDRGLDQDRALRRLAERTSPATQNNRPPKP